MATSYNLVAQLVGRCGYCLNADLNASINIREKYLTSLASIDTSLLAGTPVNVPIVPTLWSEEQAPVLEPGVVD